MTRITTPAIGRCASSTSFAMTFGSKTMSAASRIATSPRSLAYGAPEKAPPTLETDAAVNEPHQGGAHARASSQRVPLFARRLLPAGLVCAGAAPALAQSPPDFSGANLGWVAVG